MIQGRPSAKFLGAIFHVRHIGNADRRAPARSHDDVAELVGRGNTAERAQIQFLRARDHSAAGSFNIFPLQRVAHVQHREIVSSQLLGVEQDSHLSSLAAIQLDAAHSIHGLDRAPD